MTDSYEEEAVDDDLDICIADTRDIFGQDFDKSL